MDSLFSAIWWILHPVLKTIDPLCGPVGVFSLFFRGGLLSCGNEGWGDEIAQGFYVTASLAICTLPLGLIVGFFLALAKQSSVGQLRTAADIYTTLFRGLPELLTLFIVFYGLQVVLQNFASSLGMSGPIEINSFFAGMISIGLVFSAYCSEVLQSAFKAIPQGQYEGGFAIGLTRGQTMRLVILPQLVRIALPGLGNLWMTLLKDTALVSAIGLPDILRQTGVAAKVTKHAFLFFSVACILFLVLALLSSIIFGWIENQSRRAEVRK
ncbi:ABC transporter permease [Rhizobium setariae]|uniref:ABC transporter permease n=1 Tax=Rhizobium setariae TaxID=2801340 RepID=UPI003CCF33DB